VVEWDPATGKCLGLRIWEGVTNLVLRSEDFTTTWITFRGSITPNAIAAPSGATTADKLVEDTTANLTHGTYQVITVANGTQYTFSVFAKAGERTAVSIRAGLTGGEANAAIFNLATGTVTISYAGYTAQIVNAGNGWYRCAVTATSSVTSSVFVITTAISGNNSYTGDGTSGIYLWGAQLTTGSVLAPYVPTTGSTATTSATLLSLSGEPFSRLWNKSELSFVADFTCAQAATGSSQFFMRASDNSYSNQSSLSITSLGFPQIATAAGGVFDGNASAPNAITSGTPLRIAGALQTNDLVIDFLGATGTDSTATLPSSLTRLDIGSDHLGLNRVTGMYLRRLAIYAKRLTNSQLRQLNL